MNPVIALIFAHFIADWALQPEWIATNKGKYWFVMSAHCIIYTGILAFCLDYFNIYANWKIFFLCIGHYIVDDWKCRSYNKVSFCQQTTYKHLYVDQTIHLLQCIIVGLF